MFSGLAPRRRWHLHCRPQHARPVDVQRLLAGAVAPSAVFALMTRVRQQQLAPDLLWSWAQSNGAAALALALCADFGTTDFRSVHVDLDGLDPQSLRMLAELNGGGLGAQVLAELDLRAVAPATRGAVR